jgi:hypothetical protein
MEGTSGADDLSAVWEKRLLQEEVENFALFFSSNGFLEVGSRRPRRPRDQFLHISVSLRRILGAIEGTIHRLPIF